MILKIEMEFSSEGAEQLDYLMARMGCDEAKLFHIAIGLLAEGVEAEDGGHPFIAEEGRILRLLRPLPDNVIQFPQR